MKIIMQEGKGQPTEEIINIARGYDFYTCYIENYGQMKQADERNDAIMKKLEELGVERIHKDDDY
jgi:hypothetical protein